MVSMPAENRSMITCTSCSSVEINATKRNKKRETNWLVADPTTKLNSRCSRRPKLTMILAIEELRIGALGLGLLDLAQIKVDKIAHIAGIEAALVLIDHILIEALHLSAILGDLVLGRRDAGEALQCWYIVHGVDLSKQTHALLDQEVEAPELRIVQCEAGGHHQSTDDIAHCQRDDWR